MTKNLTDRIKIDSRGKYVLMYKLGKFKIGDLVASYRCDENNVHMGGHGRITAIIKGLDKPYICARDGKMYKYAANEIAHPDLL